MRTSCKDTHETIRYALELEQVINQWSPEQPEPEHVFLREERNIILIITDGEPDSVSAATEALGVAPKKGFEYTDWES